MKKKGQKILLSFFLLTGIINNSQAFTVKDSLVALQATEEKNTNYFKSNIKQHAEDSINIQLNGEKVYLYGKAKIEYEKTIIEAGFIEIDWNNNTINAKSRLDSLGKKIEKPIFTDNQDSFTADEIIYNFQSKKCIIKNIRTSEGEGFILGKKVKKETDKVFYLNKGEYTTCDAHKPHYSIKANRIKIISNDKIITGPAYLSFFNIPTPLVFPFGYFPNHDKESSGIIIPSYGESNNLGFFLKDGGYYVVFNKKSDLALRSDIYSKGSWALKSQYRYKNRYKYNGNINLNYGNTINSEKGFPDYSNKKDFFIKWMHKQDPKTNPTLRFSSNINAGSSTFHRNNSYNANEYLTNTFQSSVNITKKWDNTPFNLSANLRHSQNTRTKIVNLTLPDITFNMSRIFPFKKEKSIKNGDSWYEKIGISYNMNTKNEISIADSLLFKSQSLDKFRNGIRHTIPISMSTKFLKYFNLTPKINFTERWYLSQIDKNWNGNEIIVDTINKFTRAHEYSFSTGINTKIYGMFQLKKLGISAIRHVLTPNLSFQYKPDFSSLKYNYYKEVQSSNDGKTQTYSMFEGGIFGSPSKGKQGNINMNIGNILEMKVKNNRDTVNSLKKIKIFESLNFSGSYNIFKDSLNFSNISLSGRTRMLNIFDINLSSRYDPYVLIKNGENSYYNINTYEISKNNRIARFSSLNTSIGINLKDGMLNQKDTVKTNKKFKNSWNLNINYSLNYNKDRQDTSQSLNFNGKIKIIDQWKIGFRSGYDFKKKDLSYTSVDIYKDLHCWEMLFNWIPYGFHQSYTLTIRVKAAVLQDLKFEKKKDWFSPEYN